jgi:hypothetical protein
MKAFVISKSWTQIVNSKEISNWINMGTTDLHSIFWNKNTGELVRVGDKVVKYKPNETTQPKF